jgi:hypothetical protein
LGYPVEVRASEPLRRRGEPDNVEFRLSERHAAAARPLLLNHVERFIDAVNWIGFKAP